MACPHGGNSDLTFSNISWLRSTGCLAPHLFVQALQLHLQVLQKALPLNDLPLSSPQSLVALLHLALHHLQLEDGTNELHTLWQKISF